MLESYTERTLLSVPRTPFRDLLTIVLRAYQQIQVQHDPANSYVAPRTGWGPKAILDILLVLLLYAPSGATDDVEPGKREEVPTIVETGKEKDPALEQTAEVTGYLVLHKTKGCDTTLVKDPKWVVLDLVYPTPPNLRLLRQAFEEFNTFIAGAATEDTVRIPVGSYKIKLLVKRVEIHQVGLDSAQIEIYQPDMDLDQYSLRELDIKIRRDSSTDYYFAYIPAILVQVDCGQCDDTYSAEFEPIDKKEEVKEIHRNPGQWTFRVKPEERYRIRIKETRNNIFLRKSYNVELGLTLEPVKALKKGWYLVSEDKTHHVLVHPDTFVTSELIVITAALTAFVLIGL